MGGAVPQRRLYRSRSPQSAKGFRSKGGGALAPFINMTFTQWMHAVDTALAEMTGMRSGDLYDWCYWDAWNEDECPRDVALAVMCDNGYGDFT